MRQNKNVIKKRPKHKGDSRKESWEDRESRDERRDSKRSSRSTNDPKWYATDMALLRDSSSIPFSWPLGQNFSTNLHNGPSVYSIPGLCAVKLMPTFGSGLESDALNIAASSMYTFVRHTNAGHANYDPNDLMLYVCAMTQVYSNINYLIRVYATATLYEQRNRYLPDAIFYAQHIDADSIKNNLADFRFRLNVLINKVSSIAVPATMTIFLRQAMAYAYIYAEGESVKDQIYLYHPDGFYKFELDSDSAGMLGYYPFDYSGALFTWDDLMSYAEDMFQRIWDQEDFGIMSGDILKSYGSNILTLSSVDESVPFNPIFDPMVLHQIKNAEIVSGIDKDTVWIKQNAAKTKLMTAIATTYKTDASIGWYIDDWTARSNKILTLDSVEPTPEMVIEATRLKVGLGGEKHLGTGETSILPACGSEVAVDCVMYRMTGPNTYKTWNLQYAMIINTASIAPAAFDDLVDRCAFIKAFKYCPQMIFTRWDNNVVYDTSFVIEVDNYAVLSSDDITKMHQAAILNMLNVPSVAKNVRV